MLALKETYTWELQIVQCLYRIGTKAQSFTTPVAWSYDRGVRNMIGYPQRSSFKPGAPWPWI
jgi:hypothetical protein